VGSHNPPAGDVRGERALEVLPAAGDRVAGPADGRAALPGGQGRLVEYLAHRPHLPVREHAAAVGTGHAGRLLAAMLASEEPIEHEVGDRFSRRLDPVDPAYRAMIDT
jgi:hypothetical protein